MINKLLQIIAPHYCYGCHKIGSVLCQNCKYDIVYEGASGCIVCSFPTPDGICSSCKTTYDRAWCVGDRSGPLERTIDAYKFERVKDGFADLAELLDATLPVLPEGVVIVPVPTIPSHIRQRGYDHIRLLATDLARRRSLVVSPCLRRADSRSIQRGSNKALRMKQAESAFECPAALNPDAIYLLIDDVVTTNATVRHAAGTLRAAGATTVWVAVVARQPLDKVA